MKSVKNNILHRLNILLLFLLIFSSHKAICQEEINWFEPGTSWTYNYQNFSGPEQYQAQFIISEAVFAGKACAKMETTEDYPFQCTPFETPFYFYESNDSVFYATELDNTFRLAYNFNAEVGDSWSYSIPITTGGLDEYLVEVIEVNNIEIDGNMVKEMVLNYQNISEEVSLEIFPEEFSVIEYLGSTSGLFVPFGQLAFCDAETAIQLQCFNSSSFDYTNPDFGTCFLAVSSVFEPIELKIYPNPAREFIMIETPLESRSRIKISQADGKIVFDQYIVSNTTRIDLPDIGPGVYLVEVINDSKKYIGKLVLQ